MILVTEKKLFEILLDKMTGLEDKIDGLEDNIAGLEDNIAGLEDKIDGLGEKMDGMEKRMGSIEVRMDGMEERMGSIEVRMDGMEKRMATKDDVKELSRRMNAIYEQTAMLTEFRTETNNKLGDISNTIEFLMHKSSQTEKEIYTIKKEMLAAEK